jgi:hypothetical protein
LNREDAKDAKDAKESNRDSPSEVHASWVARSTRLLLLLSFAYLGALLR